MHPFDLSGKVFLVVGAASETGKAICTAIHSLGAFVFLVDRNEDVLHLADELNLRERFSSAMIDYFNPDLIQPGINKISNQLHEIHGIAFCGGSGGVRPLTLTKPSFILEMMNANLISFVELVRSAIRTKLLLSGSSIVAISSVSSIKGLKSKLAYSASKAALDASVRAMAAELGDKKIRVNSILKGWVVSDMQQDFIQNNMALSKNSDFEKQFMGAIDPSEIANLTAFLLSDAAPSITGTSVLLDGGYSL